MHRSFYTKNLHTEKFIPIEAFTYRRFYAKKLLHTETFAQKLCTQKFSHKKLYTEELLHKETCTHRRVYTVAFTQKIFCTEKSLPIFHRVKFLMIIHHLSSSYYCFHALLFNSFRRLVFISHGILSVHASSSLPLRRSKLNENPGIIATRKMG